MTAFAAELRILSNLSSTFLTGPSETHSFHLLNFRTESLLEDDYVGHVRRYAVSEQGFCVDAGRHRSRPRLKDQCRGSGSIFLSAVLSIAHMEQHKRKMTFGDLMNMASGLCDDRDRRSSEDTPLGDQELTILVCLTSLRTRNPPMLPKLNRQRALFVLTKIDETLAWERRKEAERDTRFVELGRYLCEVRAGQYWRLEKLKSFDEFLERRFPESRRKAYYLMSIREHLPAQARKELKEVGWTKGLELAKVARRAGQHFDCATWLHRAREMPKEEFKREVEKELSGKETEQWEIIYFKLYKSQIPVIEQAIETAALMLGSDKSRGYCLEMICADFLAGASLDNGNPRLLWQSISRFFNFLPGEQKHAFLSQANQRTA